MTELVDLSRIWAELGGLNGLIILSLLFLVSILVFQVMKISNRLIDFKASMYSAGILPDRRGQNRKTGDNDS